MRGKWPSLGILYSPLLPFRDVNWKLTHGGKQRLRVAREEIMLSN